jgi:hypothetical protein
MNFTFKLHYLFSRRKTPVTQLLPTGSARVFVLAVVILLHTAGFSIAGVETAAEPPSSAETIPWPGPVSGENTVPWPGPAPWEQTEPWPGPVPWPEPAPWFVLGPSTGFFRSIGKSMDKTHAMLERNILKQEVHFDNFFGSVKPEHLRQTSYDLRLRNSVTVEKGRNVRGGASLLANFTLSKIDDRLHLFIVGENEPVSTQQSLPEDPGNPGFDRTTPTTHFANTEIRYELIQKHSLNLFLGAGVRLALPFEVFARSRVQYMHNLNDIFLIRAAETFFVKNTDLFGETTELSLERLIGGTTLLRWSGAGTASREINGLEWGSELSLSRLFSSKDALTLKGGVFGNTNFSPQVVQNYLVLARYRRNFLRSWLFYEVEPQVSWPRNPDGSMRAVPAITFRIEIAFQGTTTNK